MKPRQIARARVRADIAAFVQAHAQVHADRDDPIYAAAVGHLDEGEAQALSLAHALGCGVLMDERRGRQTAIRQGVPLFGVLGVLLQAKRTGKLERIGTDAGQRLPHFAGAHR